MPRYYEVEALIEFVKQYSPNINGATTLECVERAIRNAPTSDVVPRSDERYMLKADGTLEMIPSVESVRANTIIEMISGFEDMLRRFYDDDGFYYKLDKYFKEFKNKYIGEKR